jgi:single-strand DNA-binding protein
MNVQVIKGRLTRDPETREIKTGDTVCNFSVAVDKYGEGANFFRVAAWRKRGEFVQKFFRKGQEILVEGSMEQDFYESSEGHKTETWTLNANRIEFCGKKSDNSNPAPVTPHPFGADEDGVIPDDDDDLPF